MSPPRSRPPTPASCSDDQKSASAFECLEKRLDRARTSGDWELYEAVWRQHWETLFTTAYHYCRRIGCDDSTARQRATDALGDAWAEIGAKLAPASGKGQPAQPRPGDPEFLKWLRARVIFRCKDGRRTAARWDTRHQDIERDGEEGRDDPWDTLLNVAATQEEDLLNGESVSALVERLSAVREMCRHREVLVLTINVMCDFVRACLVETVPPEMRATELSLDDLVERADLMAVGATRSDMLKYVTERLSLTRVALDTRMADIREYVNTLRERQSGPGAWRPD